MAAQVIQMYVPPSCLTCRLGEDQGGVLFCTLAMDVVDDVDGEAEQCPEYQRW
jgi:hypothetical protein